MNRPAAAAPSTAVIGATQLIGGGAVQPQATMASKTTLSSTLVTPRRLEPVQLGATVGHRFRHRRLDIIDERGRRCGGRLDQVELRTVEDAHVVQRSRLSDRAELRRGQSPAGGTPVTGTDNIRNTVGSTSIIGASAGTERSSRRCRPTVTLVNLVPVMSPDVAPGLLIHLDIHSQHEVGVPDSRRAPRQWHRAAIRPAYLSTDCG